MIDFEIRQLEYFVHAAKTGSITKAAEQLSISQQALSKGIRALEAETGIALFNRGPAGVVLTDGGSMFLKRAESALEALESCEQSIRSFKQNTRETIRMGISPMCFDERGGTLSTEKLAAFQQRRKNTEVVFHEMPVGVIGSRVVEGVIRFGIAPIGDESGVLELVDLAPYQMAVIMSKGNRLCAQDAVSLSELSKGRVVLPQGEQEGDDYLNPFFKKIWAEFDLAPVQAEYADASKLVADADTYVIRPMQHALRTTSPKHSTIRPIVDDEGKMISVALNLFWLRARSLNDTERELVNYITELYKSTH